MWTARKPKHQTCNVVYVWFLAWLVSTPSFLLESFCHSLNTTSFVPDFAQGPAERDITLCLYTALGLQGSTHQYCTGSR